MKKKDLKKNIRVIWLGVFLCLKNQNSVELGSNGNHPDLTPSHLFNLPKSSLQDISPRLPSNHLSPANILKSKKKDQSIKGMYQKKMSLYDR